MSFNSALKKINQPIKTVYERFFLFKIVRDATHILAKDLNETFVTLLKSYKILGRILNGTIEEFYKNRNRVWFKNFFVEKELYELVKQDIEELYPKYKNTKVIMTKRGVIIYDNYKKNSFNILLMTIHSGIWIDKKLQERMCPIQRKILREEDIGTDKIYRKIILEQNGIWIDNKQSRFICDFNRDMNNAIHTSTSQKWIEKIWKEPPTESQKKYLLESYKEFYFTLTRLVETYRFNIIFDAHSMRNLQGRPSISFGTKYIPTFYLPIVHKLAKKFNNLGYEKVRFNYPFKGGYILNFLSTKFPDVFIFSMEINKRLYLDKTEKIIKKRKVKKLSENLLKVFKFEKNAT
ncbi:N-formylglutamate amidohydrolase [Candidatus Woesearchaeota archaeon]|nr:N-formylglutamate amidohydrolase [Candidatus Woesearchaeota archaeon]